MTNKNELIFKEITANYPAISFKEGDNFIWSPEQSAITYVKKEIKSKDGLWSLIHELAHSELKHRSYRSDFELIQMEAAAWSRAKVIAKKYALKIDEGYIQDCLDTYRDWLHERAKCPRCGVVTIQKNDLSYLCFNCTTTWSVPKSPLCRVNKKLIKK